MLSTFLCTYWLFIYLLWENMYLILLPVFNSTFLALSYISSSYLSDITPYQIHVVYNCFPFHPKVFSFCWFFCCVETIYFDVVPFVYFVVVACVSGCHIFKVTFLMFVVVSVVSFRTLPYRLQQYSTELYRYWQECSTGSFLQVLLKLNMYKICYLIC